MEFRAQREKDTMNNHTNECEIVTVIDKQYVGKLPNPENFNVKGTEPTHGGLSTRHLKK